MEPHALIIGGTGMLADASVALANNARVLTLVASTDRSLNQLSACLPKTLETVHLLRADWTKPAAFLAVLQKHFQTAGFPSLTVAWLHADEMGQLIAEEIDKSGIQTRFIQILGSQSGDPKILVRGNEALRLSWVSVEQVILGFKLTESASRWLTHEEICAGVLDAVESGRSRYVVGTVEPWSARP